VNDPEGKKGIGIIMLTSFIWTFITVTALAVLISKMSIEGGISSAVKMGLTTGVCFFSTCYYHNLFILKKPLGLHLIDSGYHAAGQIIAAIMLILWK
jgi:hypothetical protein